MEYEYEMMMEEMLESGIASGMMSNAFSTLLSIAVYVLTALALYDIAKRRGINKPWLAWIPVVNVWVLGCISDQYRYVVKNEVKSKRKVLITLNVILMVIYVIMVLVAVGMLVAIFANMEGMISGSIGEEALLEMVMGPAMAVVLLFLPMLGVSIAYAVVYYMALYDVYRSLDPDNTTLFLVLSILFGVTEPFFLFFNRKKDLGMPPRRPEPAYYEPPAYMPAQDEPVWRNEE